MKIVKDVYKFNIPHLSLIMIHILIDLSFAYVAKTSDFKFLPKRSQASLVKCLNQRQSQLPTPSQLVSSLKAFVQLQQKEEQLAKSEQIIGWFSQKSAGLCLLKVLDQQRKFIKAGSIRYFILKKTEAINSTLQKAFVQPSELSQLLFLFKKFAEDQSEFSYLDMFFHYFRNASGFFTNVRIEECMEEQSLGLISEVLNDITINDYVILLSDMYQKFKFAKLKEQCKSDPIVIQARDQFVACSKNWDLFEDMLQGNSTTYVQSLHESASVRAMMIGQFIGKKIRQACTLSG